MRRHLLGVTASLLLVGCASSINDLQQLAQQKLEQSFATEFGHQFGEGIDMVVSELGRVGGYLDDPLIRILIPPPLGLVMSVAHDLQPDPEEAILEILMNRAAEQAVSGAGPVLQRVIERLDRHDIELLLAGDKTAASDFLHSRAESAVMTSILPVVESKLEESGADILYAELLAAHKQVGTVLEEDEMLGASVEADELGEYVAGKAAEGLFVYISQQEKSIRETLTTNQLIGKDYRQ